jgi:type II secretory pathway pseudopilin PulG
MKTFSPGEGTRVGGLWPPGFTILEMLVAMGVLAFLMVFMFGIVAQSLQVWDTGGRKVEAAQAARVGLDRMASELQFAFAGSGAMPSTNTNAPTTNWAPFYAQQSGSTVPGESSAPVANSAGSQMLFAVSPVADPLARNGPFAEIGYFSAHIGSTGWSTLSSNSYYLLRHGPFLGSFNSSVVEPVNDFYYRGPAPTTNWLNNGTSTTNRLSVIENCWGLNLLYASNTTNGTLAFTNRWNSQTSLPAGVLATVRVMDAKTAARIRMLRPGGLTADDVKADSTTDTARVLREGSVQISRFIRFFNSTN